MCCAYLVLAIVESSDGDYPWAALYFSVAHMKKVGVTEDDGTETALRKALLLPDKTKWSVRQCNF